MLNWVLHYVSHAKHKAWVAYYLAGFCLHLAWRAIVHDTSKFRPSEAKGFADNIPELRGTTYGSDEYGRLMERLAPYIRLHYSRNSHHPEHYEEGVRGMDLLDVVEMHYDWKASTRKHADGDIIKSINHNKDRFGMSDDLHRILLNTERGP